MPRIGFMSFARETKFIKTVTPVLGKLAHEWFHPDKKSTEGLHYACTYCDMHCGRSELGHDEDCLAELGKRGCEEFARIDADPKYEKDGKGNARPSQEMKELRTAAKMRWVLGHFMGRTLTTFAPPLDYSLAENHNVLCYCNLMGDGCPNDGEPKMSHEDDCPVITLGNALAELIRL